VKIRYLASAHGRPELQYLTTFIVNDTVAIDAGALGYWGEPADQSSVGHVFLSHSHADHVGSLPIFITNVLEIRPTPVVVHSHAAVLDSLTQDVFNGRLWPNFLRLTHRGAPVLVLEQTAPGEATRVDGLSITPVPVNHPVPTMAYLVDDGESAIVISTDSGPTSDIWEAAARVPHLKAVFMGASYPEAERDLAAIAGHMTPSMVREEIAKIPAGVRIVAVHIKPSHHAEVTAQLAALGEPRLSIGESGRTYLV
jgi:cAMP phosphodiesterase